jgi:hypothetical protein
VSAELEKAAAMTSATWLANSGPPRVMSGEILAAGDDMVRIVDVYSLFPLVLKKRIEEEIPAVLRLVILRGLLLYLCSASGPVIQKRKSRLSGTRQVRGDLFLWNKKD